MSNKIYFYFHGGSRNHGCEAIVRSTTEILKPYSPILISNNPAEDKEYGVQKICDLRGKTRYNFSLFDRFRLKFYASDKYAYELRSKYEIRDLEAGSIALSIGGDNYCYGEAGMWYLHGLNKYLHRKKIRTVLWGCSIEPETVTNEMKRGFSMYDLIVAREKISYDFLKKINANTIFSCDPAFTLGKSTPPLPDNFIPGKTIGINVSPLIQKLEQVPGMVFENYKNLIQHILEKTNYQIALIPHVVSEGSDDRVPLTRLYNEFAEQQRMCLINDMNCEKLKGIISKCAMFIGARTHATIAAYSSYVPTLVVGYSTKSIGIARDLFGTERNYVIPVKDMKSPMQLANAFEWLLNNSQNITHCLKSIMPGYMQTLSVAREKLKEIIADR